MAEPALESLIAIALEAGGAIMPHYEGGTDARQKEDGSPVTAADEAAEEIIIKRLTDAGASNIVAEEAVSAGKMPPPADVFYLVDPLDGTREFISKNGEFTVNIARVEGGVPVAGVVYAPAIGVIYAGDDTGAWRATVNDGAIGPQEKITVAAPEKAVRVVASRSHLTDETKAFIDRYDVESFVSSGSSLKFCRVAEAAADLYPRMGRTMEWDTAAGHAVLKAAGGNVYTLDGKPLFYGKRDGDTFANPYFVAAGAFDPFTLAA
ncbi:MAG: 3'(2'),5'-bisphosphate nucleotidase CysQ [Pseudomonadota bacterium]